MQRAFVLAAALCFVSLGAGCGGAKQNSDVSVLRHGRAIFVRSCAGCHSLVGHEVGASGGDLAIGHLDVRDLASFARIMPTRPRLTNAEVEAVAEYVHAASSHPR
jgi:mono/diheme cytochrome c family protein